MNHVSDVVTLALAAGSLQEWQDFAKILVGIAAGALTVSGALFAFAWAVVQKARNEWFKLADEWCGSDHFRSVVNEIRKVKEVEFTYLINEKISNAMREHNSDDDAHPSLQRRRKGDE